MIGQEVLQVAAIIDQFLFGKPLDQLVDDGRHITLVEQLAAQAPRRVVAPRQCIERRESSRARIVWIYLAAAQITPLWRRHPGSWSPSPESTWREFAPR